MLRAGEVIAYIKFAKIEQTKVFKLANFWQSVGGL